MAETPQDLTLIAAILRGALERLHRGWTRGHQARTRAGDPVPPEHPDATSWCTFGALRAECLARFPDRPGEAHLLAEAAAKHLGLVLKRRGEPIRRQSAPRTLMEWNDGPAGSQLEAVALYREALESLARGGRAVKLKA